MAPEDNPADDISEEDYYRGMAAAGHVQTEFDYLAGLTLDPALHPPVQYQEGRRYFFAGVLWAIGQFERVAAWEHDPTGEKARRYLESLRAECEQFGRDVAAGKR